MKNDNKYFEVIAKCGHVGKRFYNPVKFAIKAQSGKEAAKIVRRFPRVKHDHKDAILSVRIIDYKTFLEIIDNNSKDEYLKCKSKSQQRLIKNLADSLEIDYHNKRKEYDKKERLNRVNYKLKKNEIIIKSLMEDYQYEYLY